MALHLPALETFVKVAELTSFTRAAAHLNMPKARVSLHVKRLEKELGATLFQRSTRTVRLTAEGEQLLARARGLLTEADDVGTMFHTGRGIRGRVRVDFPVGIAREVIIPRLPKLLQKHPKLELTISATDRRTDVFREGLDGVLRVGETGDPALVGRTIGSLEMINCASPGYLREYGIPQRLEDLERHLVIHYSWELGVEMPFFEHPIQGGYRQLRMRSIITVNNVDAYHAACIAGLGIIQVPRLFSLASMAAGTLVEVLPNLTRAPLPVSLFHAHGRSVPRRVRVTMDWIAEQMGPYLKEQRSS